MTANEVTFPQHELAAVVPKWLVKCGTQAQAPVHMTSSHRTRYQIIKGVRRAALFAFSSMIVRIMLLLSAVFTTKFDRGSREAATIRDVCDAMYSRQSLARLVSC